MGGGVSDGGVEEVMWGVRPESDSTGVPQCVMSLPAA